MRKRWFVLVSLIGFLFLQGCSTTVVKKTMVKKNVTPVANGFTVTYELPNTSGIETVNLTNSVDGISFYSFCSNGNKISSQDDKVCLDYEVVSNDLLRVVKYTQTSPASEISYNVHITRKVDNGKKIIILSPIERETKEGQIISYITNHSLHAKSVEKNTRKTTKIIPIPKLSIDDLKKYLVNGFIVVKSKKIEVDSTYSVEPLYGNFKRLLKSVEDGKTVTGKIIENTFYIDLNINHSQFSVPSFVEVYPYRNGSKAVVSLSNLKLYAMNENGVYRFNVSQVLKELKDKITKVVNN